MSSTSLSSCLNIHKSDFAHSNGNCHIHHFPSIENNTLIGTTGADGELSIYHVINSSPSVIGHKRLHFSPIRDSHIFSIEPLGSCKEKSLACCISVGSDGQLRVTEIITKLSTTKDITSHVQSPKTIINNICLLESLSSDGFVSSRLSDEFRMYARVTKNSQEVLLAFTDSTGMLWMHKLRITPSSSNSSGDINDNGDNVQITSEPIPFTLSSPSNQITSFLHLSDDKFIILRQSGIVELFTNYSSTSTLELSFPTSAQTQLYQSPSNKIIIRDSKSSSSAIISSSLKNLSTSKIPSSYLLSLPSTFSTAMDDDIPFLASTQSTLTMHQSTSTDNPNTKSISCSFQSPSDSSLLTKAPQNPNSYVFLPLNQIGLISSGRLLVFSFDSLKKMLQAPLIPPPPIKDDEDEEQHQLLKPNQKQKKLLQKQKLGKKIEIHASKSSNKNKKGSVEYTDSSDDQMETDDDGFEEFEDYDCSSMDGEAGDGDGDGAVDAASLNMIRSSNEHYHPQRILQSPAIGQTTPHWSVDGTGGYRYLCWNNIASVTSRKDSTYFGVEIDFHDRSFHRPIRFIDEFGYEMASLTKDGALFSTSSSSSSCGPGSSDNPLQESRNHHHHLYYLPFDSPVDDDPLHPKPLKMSFDKEILSAFLIPSSKYPIVLLEEMGLIRTFTLSGIEGRTFKAPSGHFISFSSTPNSFSITTIRNGNQVNTDIFILIDTAGSGGAGSAGCQEQQYWSKSSLCAFDLAKDEKVTWTDLDNSIMTIIIDHRNIFQTSTVSSTPFYSIKVLEEDVLPLKVDYSGKPSLVFLKGIIPEFIPKPSPQRIFLQEAIGAGGDSLSKASMTTTNTEELKLILQREKEVLRLIEASLLDENYFKAKELSLMLSLRPSIEGAHKLCDHLNAPFIKEFLLVKEVVVGGRGGGGGGGEKRSKISSLSGGASKLKERRERIIGGMAGDFVIQEHHQHHHQHVIADVDISTNTLTEVESAAATNNHRIKQPQQREESQTLFDFMETINDDDC